MRAVYLEKISQTDTTVMIDGAAATHLLKVLRIKLGDKVLGLDGKGGKYSLEVTDTGRSEINCKIISFQQEARKRKLDLAIGQTKKEALDLILKQACELGIATIHILETTYSNRYKLNLERAQKLLISGVEQSNNPYLPQIILSNLDEVDYTRYADILFFSSIEDGVSKELSFNDEDTLFIIGPEGGFSGDEEKKIRAQDNCKTFLLDTYILRSQTALSAAVGFYHGVCTQKLAGPINL